MTLAHTHEAKNQSAWQRTKEWLTRVDEAIHFDPVEHLQGEVADLAARLERLERHDEDAKKA